MSAEADSTSGATLRAALLAGWLVAIDVWVDIVARLGACPAEASGAWSPTVACSDVPLVGDLVLRPAVREGLPGATFADPLERQLAALAVIAAVTIVAIIVGRSRARQPADLLALGCLAAGAIVWGAPVLVGPGVAFTSLASGSFGFGIGDLAMACGALWLLVERLRA